MVSWEGLDGRMPTLLARAARTLAGAWNALEHLLARLRRRLRRQQRQLEAEARQLGLQLLDVIDDLPFVPTLVPIRPVHNQFYGHGAFMGAAPALLADETWRRILAFLMPDVYVQVDAALKDGADNARLIPMFENNPVMCAFGCLHGVKRRAGQGDRPAGDLTGMEWDVFVDSAQVEAWEALGEPVDSAEREALVDAIVDRMVIAHASTADTVQESVGVCQYPDVRRTVKTGMGGVLAPAWMDLFTRSLRLAKAPDLRRAIDAMALEPRSQSQEECESNTFLRPVPMVTGVAEYEAATGQRFSVVLEMKTLRSTPVLLAAMVRALNRRGVHVAAVCSFSLDEVRGVSGQGQRLQGRGELPGPREILFFHYAGDVQHACEQGALPPGQGVLFNGATLLRHTPDEPGAYGVDANVVDGLAAYRERFGIDIGVYVQEGDCDALAAGALSEVVGANPATFALGFAWGGLLDEAHVQPNGTDRRGLGGQAMLGMIGRAREWTHP